MQTWAARHPHPGTSPEKPTDAPPQLAAGYESWWQARERWNSYVLAVRRHELARYVDRITAVEEARPGDVPVTDLALRTIAMMVLDGSIPSNFVVPAGIWRL